MLVDVSSNLLTHALALSATEQDPEKSHVHNIIHQPQFALQRNHQPDGSLQLTVSSIFLSHALAFSAEDKDSENGAPHFLNLRV